MDWVLDDIVGKVICLPDNGAGLYPAAGQPERETAWVMIPSVIGLGELSLRIDTATKFAAPNDQGIVQ